MASLTPSIMKNGSTLFLRAVIVGIGLAALAVFALALPYLIHGELQGDFDYGVIFVGLYAPGIPFFIALFQGMKLLSYIDKNKAFSEHAVKALRTIKWCGLSISGLFAAGMPYIFKVADQDDAPGVVLIGLIIIGASFVIALFAALLEKLLHNVIEIKSENELTV